MLVSLTFNKCLAEGAYGRIYTSEETPNTVYKVFFDKFVMPPPIEIDCMFRLSHENIMCADCIYTIAKVPSKLKKAPEKVELYKDGRGKFIVIQMEKATGDLFDWKKKNPSYEQKVSVIWDVLKAVDFIHNCHLLHLDIKTENILIMKNGRAKLTDFGLVIPITTHGRTRNFNREMITVNYRPPENLNKSRSNTNRFIYRQASDVWSLGILISEIFMPYYNGYFIEDKQVKMVEKILSSKNIQNTFFAKIGRGLDEGKKKQWLPVISAMLELDFTKRPSVKEIMQLQIFKDLGYEYDNEGFLLQPNFPESDLDLEDYSLKLEYFLHKVMRLISYFSVELNNRYPIQVLFLACDIFIRYRHFYDSSEDISALSVFVATYLICEREIELIELEESLGLEMLESKFRNFLFLNEKIILFTENPFSVATCQCRMNKLLKILFTDFKTYVKMIMESDFSPITKTNCKIEPDWCLNGWVDHIQKLCPALELYTLKKKK